MIKYTSYIILHFPLLRITFCLFVAVFVLMIVFILCCLIVKKANVKRKSKWSPLVSRFIQTVIFKEINKNIHIPSYVNRLLKTRYFRRYVAAEIRKIKASLSGDAAFNLIQLYKILKLEQDLNNKLNSTKWHLKAQAIKEIADMDLQRYSKDILRYTDHSNEFLRIEAQCAMVHLNGFSGLHFLNVTTYPLSDWQQILLLEKLNHTKACDCSVISKWLLSKQDSVIIFALKLVSKYKCYELHQQVVSCLDHPSSRIRIEAIKCLRDIFMEDTTEDLISHQKNGNKQYELLLLGSLQGYKPNLETGFLVQQLGNQDDDIKYAAAKILFEVMPEGENILYNYPSAAISPWKQIITDLKDAKAA